jgi:HAE1 family hydrophobic/amphiphilic exporter-1
MAITAPKKGFVDKFYAGFNGGFNYMTNRYVGGLKFLIKNKWVSMAGLAVLVMQLPYLPG